MHCSTEDEIARGRSLSFEFRAEEYGGREQGERDEAVESQEGIRTG